MSVSELQNYTFVSRYARWLKDNKRRETWRESVDRVMGMMYKKYPEVNGEIAWAYDMMFKKRVLGSQRALQFGGSPVFKHNAKKYTIVYPPFVIACGFFRSACIFYCADAELAFQCKDIT